jgi:hypothetical protein
MRSSGLGLETAANQVRQQTGSVNAALQTSLGDIGNSYDQQAKRTQGGYEARGVLRSGETQQGLDQVERARLSAQTTAQNNAANQIGTLNSGLVNKVLDAQNRAAELGLTTGQNQDYDAATPQFKTRTPRNSPAEDSANGRTDRIAVLRQQFVADRRWEEGTARLCRQRRHGGEAGVRRCPGAGRPGEAGGDGPCRAACSDLRRRRQRRRRSSAPTTTA